MRATKLSTTSYTALLMSFAMIALGAVMFYETSEAKDEIWEIVQVRKKLESNRVLLIEYVRRDFIGSNQQPLSVPYSNRMLDLYRVSIGFKVPTLQRWTALLGGAFIDFERGNDERRLHQFLVGNYSLESYEDWASATIRLGLEERCFNDDNAFYLRSRARLQIDLRPMDTLGPAVYDELFFVADGGARFASGFNENRLGLGLRLRMPAIAQDHGLYLFHTSGFLQTLRSTEHFEWYQLQFTYSF